MASTLQEVRADEPAPIDVTVRGSSAPAFVSRASSDDRRREPIDAASMLAELPSVHVRRLGALGAQAAISIRGSASSQVGVLLNGIPLTSGADPSFDVGSLPLWPGASFRVYRGFAPGSLGATGYLGGLLAIDPPSSLTGARTDAQLVAGSFGTLQARVADARQVGPVKLGVGVFGSRSAGDFSYSMADDFSNQLVTRTRMNAEAVNAGMIGRAAWERSWGTVGATWFADARHVGLPGNTQFTTSYSGLDTQRAVAGLDASTRIGKTASFRAQVWGRGERTRFTDPRGEIDGTRSSNLAEQLISAVGFSAVFRGIQWGPAAIVLFADGRNEHLSPASGSTVLGAVEASRLAGGTGFEVETRLRSFRLFASGRLDVRHDEATGIVPGKAPDQGPTTDVFPSGHVGISYRIGPVATISSHVGYLRRFPGFAELYGDRGTLVGDPRLRTERALSADLGVQGDIEFGRVKLGYEAAGFVTNAQDLIVFLPLGLRTFRATNIGAATLVGTEVAASLSAKNLLTTLSYTFLYTNNQSDDRLAYGNPLPGRPMHDFSYDAAYQWGPLGVRYGVDAIAGTTLDTSASYVLPPRLFHNAGMSLDVPGFSRLRIGIEVQNLFDVRVMRMYSPGQKSLIPYAISDFMGFPLPGRSFWATLRFRQN